MKYMIAVAGPLARGTLGRMGTFQRRSGYLVEAATMIALKLALGACILAATLAVATARAETVNCTPISALPAIISSSGVYCLRSDLSMGQTSGAAITIDANDVVLDLNGHVIDGSGAGAGTWAIGILIYEPHNQVTVRNGTVRGFLVGVVCTTDDIPIRGPVIASVESIRALNNTGTGISLEGYGHTVRGNVVMGTGGTSHGAHATGIAIGGVLIEVSNNDVVATYAGSDGTAVGISTDYNGGHLIERNRIAFGNMGAEGTSYGIFIHNENLSLVIANSVSQFTYGVHSGSSGVDVKYRNNLTTGVTTPYTGGTNAGGNF